MKLVRKNRANRLAAMIGYRRGLSLDEATKAAEANLALIEGDCLASLDQALAVIYQHVPQLCQGQAQPHAETIYQAANQVLSLGAHCQRATLGKAAYCLCDLIDRSRATGRWNAPALEAHLKALKRLRHPEADTGPEIEEAVIDGLLKVNKKVSR
jgi:hypothetical protein